MGFVSGGRIFFLRPARAGGAAAFCYAPGASRRRSPAAERAGVSGASRMSSPAETETRDEAAMPAAEMWLWFVLFDPLVSSLLIVPLIVWVVGPERYHRYILAAGAAVFVFGVLPAGWMAYRRWRAKPRSFVAQDLVWRRGAAAAGFLAQASAYLRSCGWRVGEASIAETGWPVMVVQRDRVRWGLVFLPRGEGAGDRVGEAVRALRAAQGVKAVAVVVQRGVALGRAPESGVEIVREGSLLATIAREF